MAPVGLQDADIDVLGARLRPIALDELEELNQEAFVPRERRLAPAFVAELLQVGPCEVAYGAIWPEIPGIDVGGRSEAVRCLGLSRFSCNPHSARCLARVPQMCQVAPPGFLASPE